MKICSWRFFLWKMEIFPFEDLFVEIFPWRFILEIKLLKIFNEDLFMEIFPWRFILKIFPLKFWNFLLKICSLEIFPLEYEEFSFWKWRFILWKQSEEDEDGLEMMKIYSWWFFFFFEKPILWMRTTLARSWCGLLDKSLALFLQKDNFN